MFPTPNTFALFLRFPIWNRETKNESTCVRANTSNPSYTYQKQSGVFENRRKTQQIVITFFFLICSEVDESMAMGPTALTALRNDKTYCECTNGKGLNSESVIASAVKLKKNLIM